LFVAPFYGLNPQPPGWGQAQIFVPIDDTHTAFYNVRWSVDAIGPIDDVMRQNMAIHFGSSPGIDLDERFVKRAKSENGWLQDREAMRRGESRNGIRGIVVQDHAVQESMGAIVDRTKEHLGPTDLAIIHMRRRMLQSLDHFEEGHSPIGLDPAPDYGTIRADEGLIPIDAPWQAVQAVAESALSMMS
jgi:phthalate 4,5-dioxygenase oxygenase subunit